ncbi:MAG: M48 family metalloprotease, partial [Rhodospirillaceae bacterium]|nr:M48 family metalloprotease [Rhodospirillaceae bacterium]
MKPIARVKPAFALLLAAAVLAGCSKNPVTGEKEFAPYSTRDEINLGKRHYAPLQQAQGGRFKTDPKLAAYVRGVGRRVARVSDRTKLPYEFVVINNSVPNAWALPGGKIAVNRGLLLEMENEAELAAVLSHEVVHAAARHGGQALTRNLLFGAAQIAIALSGRKSRHINYILGGTGLAFQLINRSYSRGAEREADFYGMKYMHKAGYDTRAAVTLQQKFLALSKGRRQDWLTGLFATHPPSKERVKNNRKALK